MNCQSCQHARALHLGSLNACRVNGCHCERFADGTRREDSAKDRTLVIAIPEGFYATITVYPIDPAASAEAVEPPAEAAS